MADKHEELPKGGKLRNLPEGTHHNDGDAPEASRRRFTKAGLATPVIMSLASQPVWGAGRLCTASAFASANPSRPVDMTTCRGCSPGYWHQGVCWPSELDTLKTTQLHSAFGYDRDAYDDFVYPNDSGYPSKSEILATLDTALIDFFPNTGLGNNVIAKFVRAAIAGMLNGYHAGVPFWSDADAAVVKSRLLELFPLSPGFDVSGHATANEATMRDDVEILATWWDEGEEGCVLPGWGSNKPCPLD
ncbi:MAG: hypothetical protein U5S82_13215 [Gammaproteobacteria bacterium]|nr:hypothetical protein [Gammaproteobacteria bacterium]